MSLSDGRPLGLRVVPLPNAVTMVEFTRLVQPGVLPVTLGQGPAKDETHDDDARAPGQTVEALAHSG